MQFLLLFNRSKLKEQLYTVSMGVNSCDISEVPLFLRDLNFYIAIIEILLMLSLIVIGPPYLYAIYSTGVRTFPRRIKPFMMYAIVNASVGLLVRGILLLDASLMVSQDISIKGPLSFLHYAKHSFFFSSCMTFHGILFECFLSAHDPMKYEKDTSIGSFYYFTTANLLVTLILFPITYLRIVPIFLMSTIVFCSHIIDLLGTIVIYRKNKAYLKRYYDFSLGERFQVKQNIEFCLSMVPYLVLTFIMTAFVSGCITLTSQFDRYDCWEGFLMMLFNCGIAVYCVVSPLLQFVIWPRLGDAAFCKAKKPSIVAPELDHSTVYFTELVNQWEARHKK